ncbi:MAG TPA: aspartyl protease family protein [Saprospiraceae bacterium]|nr:aspartyl protease family protein [Saprospiraceae bacterium]
MRKGLLLLLVFGWSWFYLPGQVIGYGPIEMPRDDKIEIPFEYKNDLIIINVIFNRIFPLRFIFDTGAEYTILTRKEITDLLEVNYRRKFTLYGADLSTELVAYLAQGINLEISNLRLPNRNVLVLEEDYFSFDKFSGIDIHGIIGADVFRRYVVEIDYTRERIIFYHREDFKEPGKKFKSYPVEFHRSRPYITVPVKSANDSIVQTKLLMDSGSSLPLILYPTTSSVLEIPDKVVPGQLGLGLGGFLEGVVGRVQEIDIAGTTLPDVVTSFQDLGAILDSSALNNRNGILGNQSMQHFHVILDYVKQELYLAPNSKKIPEFKFDRSGLFVIASGKYLNEFQVASVVQGSPADEAGLQKGDLLVRINWIPCSLMSLGNIQRKFKKRVGKTFKIVFERDGKRYRTLLELEELI